MLSHDQIEQAPAILPNAPYTHAELQGSTTSFGIHRSLTTEQLLFLTNFIKDTAFYVEQLESYIGEYLDDFWEEREHAYHLTTDLLIDVLQHEAGLED